MKHPLSDCNHGAGWWDSPGLRWNHFDKENNKFSHFQFSFSCHHMYIYKKKPSIQPFTWTALMLNADVQQSVCLFGIFFKLHTGWNARFHLFMGHESASSQSPGREQNDFSSHLLTHSSSFHFLKNTSLPNFSFSSLCKRMLFSNIY